jgi:hypothetical protein
VSRKPVARSILRTLSVDYKHELFFPNLPKPDVAGHGAGESSASGGRPHGLKIRAPGFTACLRRWKNYRRAEFL